MATTYEPIATTTLSSATNTITFSSIPSTYTDLRLVFTATDSLAGNNALLRFNSVSTTTYSQTLLYGSGSAPGSSNSNNLSYLWFNWSTMDTTIPSLMTCDILAYAGSTYKTALISESANYNGSGTIVYSSGLWRSTSAISTITLSTNGGNFKVGSVATIYGIKAA